MKKALSLFLTILLCLSLCACTASNEDPTIPSTAPSTPTEPEDFSGVTVSIVSITDEEEDDLWLYKQIEEKFGCEIEVIEIPNANYGETMNQLLKDGNLPTIFESFLPIDQIVAYGEQGKFVDVLAPANLAKMPNFAKLFVEDQDTSWEYMLTAAEDGSHYILPAYGLNRAVNHFWIYNETAFKEAGVEWRGDPEGFLDMLRQLKAYYPNSYPMTGGAWSGICDRTAFTWGVNSSYAAYDYETNQWFYGATSDAYFDMLSMFQTAYNEQLMNPAILTPGSGSTLENILNHRAFLYNSWLGWMTMDNAAFAEEGVDDYELPAPTPVGPNGKTLEVKKISNLEGTVISNHDPKAAECAMAILNWMYDTSKDGGAWLNTVGPEDALQVEENGRYTWNYESEYDQMLKNEISYVADLYGMFQTSLSVRYAPESPYYTYYPEEHLAQEIGDEVGYFRAPPTVVINDDLLANIYKESQKKIQDMQVAFIWKNWTREDFDAWVADFNKNYQCVLDYLNS